MIQIEKSWRLRWPFTLGTALLALVWASAWVIRRHDAARAAYESISRQFEEPELPEPGEWDFFFQWKDLPNGRSEMEYPNGWRKVGQLESGLESGPWATIAPDGSIRARYEMHAGEQEGPCEFRDATGLRRVRGAFRHSDRIGLWTLENVLGEGTTYLYFGR